MGLTQRRVVMAVVGAVVLLTAASLGTLGWQRLVGPPLVAADGTAALGGLTAQVHAAGWVDFDMGHVMDGEGGFMMPDQMMPGAPSGDQLRLGVTLTLTNTDGRAHGFNLAEEFSLVGGPQPAAQPPSADTIGELPRLAPGAAVDGTIYFDVVAPAEADPPLYLQWHRDGGTVRLAVPLTEDAPEHQHG